MPTNAQIGGTTGNANLTREALLAYIDLKGFSRNVLSDRLLLDVEADIDETTTRIDDAVAATQRCMQRLILGLDSSSFKLGADVLKRWECELSSFDKWQAAQRRRYYFENWVHWEEEKKLTHCEGFQSLKRALGADVSTISAPVRGQSWEQPRLPSAPGRASISSSQSFTLTGSDPLHSRDEGLRILGTPDHSARPTWLAAVRESASVVGGQRDKHELATSKVEASNAIVTADLASLDAVPLWIRSAVRLGTRFLRVAASSVAPGVPYELPGDVYSCCECKRDHPPILDEYYFWLEDGRRFDPADAPAPQNADLHANTPRTNPPTDSRGPQIDPRTREADPTSDWDAPTAETLAWKTQPIIYLRWTRVHMGQLQDPRLSSEGIPLTETDAASVKLDIAGRHFDSLYFSVLGSLPEGKGLRYDIATDAAVVLPEAVKSSDPPALRLPESLTASLTAFPFFLYFAPGAPLAPVQTLSTSLVVATSLRADCRYEEACEWLRLAYDPLGRDNTWAQCQSRSVPLPEVKGKQAEKEGGASSFSNNGLDLFAIAADGANGRVEEPGASPTRQRAILDLPCCPTSPVKGAKARGRAAVLEYLETLLDWADALGCRNSLEASQQAFTLLGVIGRVLGPAPGRADAADGTQGKMTLASFQPYAAPLNPRLMALYAGSEDSLSPLRATLNKGRLRNGALGLDMGAFWLASENREHANESELRRRLLLFLLPPLSLQLCPAQGHVVGRPGKDNGGVDAVSYGEGRFRGAIVAPTCAGATDDGARARAGQEQLSSRRLGCTSTR